MVRPTPKASRSRPAKAKKTGDGIVLAYVYDGAENEVSYSWHQCLARLVDADSQLHRRLKPENGGGFISIRYGTGGLVAGRNQAVYEFLTEFPDAQWLWWLDTDMGFPADTLDLLRQAADPTERPIVGALCFSLRELDPDGMGGWHTQPTPTIYDWVTVPAEGGGEQSGWAVRWDYPRDTVTRCHGTGSACILIHRTVLERIRDRFGTWYDRVPNPTTEQYMGEDMAFCVRANALEIPVFVDTRVKTSHSKRVWIREDDYIAHRVVLAMVDKPAGSPLSIHVDVEASLATLERNEHVRPDGMLKLETDLDRYKAIINATKPEVIVETGTRTGQSALWFAGQPGVDMVVTVDINPLVWPEGVNYDLATGVETITGDSADPSVFAKVAELVAGRRCMVVLDSDHSAAHVAAEVKMYGPLVTPGCYLVVEDGIFGYATRTLRTAHGLGEMIGSPLDAIAELLDGNPDWSRDIAIERTSSVSHHPGGWWIRNG